MREVKEKIFDSIIDYNNWNSFQYHNQTGIKVVGLNELDGDRMKVQYIELF